MKKESEVIESIIGSGKQESTAKKYFYDLRKIEEISGADVDYFTKADFNRLITTLSRRQVEDRFWIDESPHNYSSSSIRSMVFALKRYWKSTDQKDKLKILENIDLPKQKPVRDKPTFSEDVLKDFFEDVWDMELSDEERKKHNIKNSFLEYRNKFIIIFSYFFATRRSEIPLIKLEGVNKHEKTIVVTENKMTGRPYVELATSDLFWNYYDQYMTYRRNIRGNFLFPSIGGDQIKPNTVYLATRMCDKLLEKYKIKGVNLTPHLMRRSLATKVAGELSLKDGMRVTRHQSVQAFQKYIDMSEDKESLERIRKSKALEV